MSEIALKLEAYFVSAISYVFGILYGAELSKLSNKIEIIVALIGLMVALLFVAQTIKTTALAMPKWKLFWQFAVELSEFLIQFVIFIFVSAMRDVLSDTTLSGPWVELVLLRPLVFVVALIFLKILIQHVHSRTSASGIGVGTSGGKQID